MHLCDPRRRLLAIGRRAEAVGVHVRPTSSLDAATLIQSHSNPARGKTLPVQQIRPGRSWSIFRGNQAGPSRRGEADLYASTYDKMNDWDFGGRPHSRDPRPAAESQRSTAGH